MVVKMQKKGMIALKHDKRRYNANKDIILPFGMALQHEKRRNNVIRKSKITLLKGKITLFKRLNNANI